MNVKCLINNNSFKLAIIFSNYFEMFEFSTFFLLLQFYLLETNPSFED